VKKKKAKKKNSAKGKTQRERVELRSLKTEKGPLSEKRNRDDAKKKPRDLAKKKKTRKRDWAEVEPRKLVEVTKKLGSYVGHDGKKAREKSGSDPEGGA